MVKVAGSDRSIRSATDCLAARMCFCLSCIARLLSLSRLIFGRQAELALLQILFDQRRVAARGEYAAADHRLNLLEGGAVFVVGQSERAGVGDHRLAPVAALLGPDFRERL